MPIDNFKGLFNCDPRENPYSILITSRDCKCFSQTGNLRIPKFFRVWPEDADFQSPVQKKMKVERCGLRAMCLKNSQSKDSTEKENCQPASQHFEPISPAVYPDPELLVNEAVQQFQPVFLPQISVNTENCQQRNEENSTSVLLDSIIKSFDIDENIGGETNSFMDVNLADFDLSVLS